MSKPEKPGELRDVDVQAISLVSKAANGEKFKIFKSADVQPEGQAPEVVEKDERGLYSAESEVEKGEVADVYHARDAGEKLHDAFGALVKVLGLSRYSDESQTPETDPAKIISAIDDFRDVAIEILLGNQEVEKAGRKISGSRLSKLKDIKSMLDDVLSGLDDTSEEASDVAQDEVQKTVNVEEIVKAALAPIIERLEKVEKARGMSNRVPEGSIVEKNVNDFWGGIF